MTARVSARTAEGLTPEIYDNTGKLLYNMADKLFAMHKTMVCEGSHGKEILKVKKKWSSE